ncbi:sensor histidine kinase [Psychrobacillus vulpis]|uniref:Signal transduction histidine-protein kinase ArlS n=1 Tax=Psychrobacillus vulpis TaxID=2325572 RepID=A0A544TTF8_9BACI|nr:HAMP domain-containing histidine kinase [Psychrobacillus vulpis]TQR20680.1 HAMP domain-containing histidine kinase [Psychrobacillus vulpis]
MKNWTLQRKWTYSSAISIFLSFLTMCIILYFSLYNWMIISEKKSAQNTLNEVVLFLESKGPFLTIQDIGRNRTLLNQIVNQEQSIRLVNKDGIEILRINDASNFPEFSNQLSPEFEREVINNQPLFYKVAEVNFGTFSGYVEISHSLENFSQVMRYILIAMVIFALISLVLSALIGYTLSSILLKPIKELRNEMQRAKQHKFSNEVSFDYSTKDEIGELLLIYKQLMHEVSDTINRQDEFIYNISHELRTPVQVIEGHLSLINRWGKDDKEVLEESLNISLEEIQKMKKLKEEMLKLARRENTKEDLQTNILNVVLLLQKEYELIQPSVSIKMDIDENYYVSVQQTALQQIIRNIIDNGIKYNENTPNIIVKVMKNQTHIIITVEDNGIGIPKDQISKIFDRFYTVDSSRTKSKGGSGLGLSIVNMLVMEYEGRIEVESTLGKGTTFRIFFPYNISG